jgi:glycine/D-amino acid oxidase-like deaminating enzyme
MDALPTTADVVIVGGGFAGVATAWALTQRGIGDVVVIEREARLGYHASGRNAALGRQLAEDDAVTAFTARGAAFLRQPPVGFAPLLTTTGSLLLVDDEPARAQLIALAQRHGIAVESVDRAAALARWPALDGIPGPGGVYVPGDGVIHIEALLDGFVAGARAAGARVVPRCELRAVQPSSTVSAGRTVEVETNLGRIRARVVVCAAGAWAGVVGALCGSSDTRFTPIKRHVFRSGPTSIGGDGAPFVWHLGARELYVRRDRDGLMLSGCDARVHPPADVEADDDAIERLRERLVEVAPALASLPITAAWACLRTFAPDHAPVIGWDRAVPWLFWVAGLGGHGATASAAIGEDAAAALAARLR